jgi:hypothetical protein
MEVIMEFKMEFKMRTLNDPNVRPSSTFSPPGALDVLSIEIE